MYNNVTNIGYTDLPSRLPTANPLLQQHIKAAPLYGRRQGPLLSRLDNALGIIGVSSGIAATLGLLCYFLLTGWYGCCAHLRRNLH